MLAYLIVLGVGFIGGSVAGYLFSDNVAALEARVVALEAAAKKIL